MYFKQRKQNPHAQSNSAIRRGRTVRLVVTAIVLLACSMTLISCKTPEERYRVLSFFFDGVPMPPSMRPVIPLEDMIDDSGNVVRRGKKKEKEDITYYHTPYTTKSGCYVSCHDKGRGFGAVLEMTGAEMCFSCHRTYFRPVAGDWAHAPVLLGDCKNCHEPHQSKNEGLLTKPQRELCFECHDSSMLDNDPFHARISDEQKCSECHDPHGAGNRQLLVDSRSYGRRKRQLRIVASNHDYRQPEDCALCHNLKQSNLRYDNLEEKCLDCHDKVFDIPEDNEMHQAVTDMQCLVCHTPHKTSRPSLLRANAEYICYSCHDKPHDTNINHPKVDRVDCLICHFGHSGDRPHLLKDGVWLPGGENPMPELELELELDNSDENLQRLQSDGNLKHPSPPDISPEVSPDISPEVSPEVSPDANPNVLDDTAPLTEGAAL